MARSEHRRTPAETRRRRPADPTGAKPPTFPKLGPKGEPWNPMTLRWWKTWRNAPQSRRFTTTDWQALLATALLVEEFWSGTGGKVGLAGEIRRREEALRETPADRAYAAEHGTGDQEHMAKPARDRKSLMRLVEDEE